MVAIGIASFLIANLQQKLETKLSDLKPVTQAAGTGQIEKNDAFSIGGVVLSEGMLFTPKNAGDNNEQKATLVYSIPANTTSFRAFFGIPDGYPTAWLSASLAVSVDGELVKLYEAQSDSKPIKIEIPTKGAKSLKLVFNGYSALGDSVFSSLASKPSEQIPKPAVDTTGLARVILTAPENGDKTKDKLVVKWDAISEAIAYGVEIVLVSNNSKTVPTRFLRSFTAKGTSFEWVFSEDVVSGEYQVSVIAFSKKGVLSRFSASKRFTVERRTATKPGNQ
ncbi:MAG: NPCBM/NEW2 domain-containing protein [Armatimonadota bacterium]